MIRKINILIITILLSYSALGQVFNAGKTQKHFYTEFKYEWIGGKIIIPVEIEGKKYRFILDTGAPNIISEKLRNNISTEFQKKILITDAYNKKDSMDLVTIPIIKIGGVKYENIPTLISRNDTNVFFKCFDIDGIIGSNLLRNSIIQILPENQLIKLTNEKKKLSLNKKYSTKLKFPDKQSTPYFWVKINANKKLNEEVYFDSGMDGFYSLSNNHFHVFRKKGMFNVITESTGDIGVGILGVADPAKYYQIVIPKLILNKTTFNNITIETNNSGNSRIGIKILKYGDVTIDYIDKRFYYEPFIDSVNLEKKSFGFNPVYYDGKLIIGIVWDKNLKSELKFGDRIIEINGTTVTNYNLCDLVTHDRFRKCNTLEMTIINSKGKEKKVVVTKKYR